jgi:hypothetical protein
MSMGKLGSLEICGLRYVTFWMDVVVLLGQCLDADASMLRFLLLPSPVGSHMSRVHIDVVLDKHWHL